MGGCWQGQAHDGEHTVCGGALERQQRRVFDLVHLDVVEHEEHLVALREPGRVHAVQHQQQLVLG